MGALMYLIGLGCLIAAPFTSSISVLTAAPFFIIGYIVDRSIRY